MLKFLHMLFNYHSHIAGDILPDSGIFQEMKINLGRHFATPLNLLRWNYPELQ